MMRMRINIVFPLSLFIQKSPRNFLPHPLFFLSLEEMMLGKVLDLVSKSPLNPLLKKEGTFSLSFLGTVSELCF
jgi:hypothetical protein